jgi:hypothetical protein
MMGLSKPAPKNSGASLPSAKGPNRPGRKPETDRLQSKKTALTHDLPPGFEAGGKPKAMKRAPGPHVKEPKQKKG